MTTLTEIKEVVNNKWREELLEGLEEVTLKQRIIEDQQKDLLADRSSPLRKYDLNFGQPLEADGDETSKN